MPAYGKEQRKVKRKRKIAFVAYYQRNEGVQRRNRSPELEKRLLREKRGGGQGKMTPLQAEPQRKKETTQRGS